MTQQVGQVCKGIFLKTHGIKGFFFVVFFFGFCFVLFCFLLNLHHSAVAMNSRYIQGSSTNCCSCQNILDFYVHCIFFPLETSVVFGEIFFLFCS